MKMKNTYNGGYVAILLLFIGIVITIFLMAQQYQGLAQREQDSSQNNYSISPIDRALNIKDTVEARDRSMLGQ